ncbi:MAG: PEGA domain-containing protein [Phycisphaerae bacterium]|nr:PEGA domain-containing protein [Phycisphaerae bacterium]
MKRLRSTWLSAAAAGLLLMVPGGCVERTARVETDPPGALVIVNDEEVGVSPVKFSFLWYGDYDIMLRKPGYWTLKTHYRIEAPWYQWPPFDLVAETMIPATIRDEHVLPTFKLEPIGEATVAEIVQRATELRDQALYEEE